MVHADDFADSVAPTVSGSQQKSNWYEALVVESVRNRTEPDVELVWPRQVFHHVGRRNMGKHDSTLEVRV